MIQKHEIQHYTENRTSAEECSINLLGVKPRHCCMGNHERIVSSKINWGNIALLLLFIDETLLNYVPWVFCLFLNLFHFPLVKFLWFGFVRLTLFLSIDPAEFNVGLSCRLMRPYTREGSVSVSSTKGKLSDKIVFWYVKIITINITLIALSIVPGILVLILCFYFSPTVIIAKTSYYMVF